MHHIILYIFQKQYPQIWLDLSCGVQCTRTILFVLNIIFLIFGFSILGLGIYVKVNGNFSAIIAAYNITQALGGCSYAMDRNNMIIVGSFTTCLAAFGCLGAAMSKSSFLYAYAVILSLIILLNLLLLLYH